MAWGSFQIAALSETDGSSVQYIAPGTVSEARLKTEENIAVTVMDSGRLVATKKSENQVETLELAFSNVPEDNWTSEDAAYSVSGFEDLKEFLLDTVGLYRELKYKGKGKNLTTGFVTYTLAQADLVEAAPIAPNGSNIYSFKITLRRVF